MGQSKFISGGRYASPSVWIALLRDVGCEVELPPDHPRTLAGGDFAVRFKHPEVTGPDSAVVEMLLAYRAIPEDAPREVLDLLNQRVEVAIGKKRPFFAFANSLTGLAWARGGRKALHEAFERLRKEGIDVSEEDLETWRRVEVWSQCIELRVYGFGFCSIVAEDLIARAIADATGGTLDSESETGRYLVGARELGALLAEYRDVPRRWEWDEGDTAAYFAFNRFESWEKIVANEDDK